MHAENIDSHGNPIFNGDTIYIRMGYSSSVFERLARLSYYPWAKKDRTYTIYDARPNPLYRSLIAQYTDDNGVVYAEKILHDHVIKVPEDPCQFIEALPI